MDRARSEAGFSYLDVMVAVAVLLVGIMALLGAMTGAITATTRNENQLVAKQFATATLEAIFTARDVNRDNTFGWDRIGNVGDSDIPGGVFLTGRRPIWPTPGADGILGTGDDDDGANGPDGTPNTSDDIQPVEGFEREIIIANVGNSPPYTMRRIEVAISYWSGSSRHREVITTFVANYRTTVE
jgi:type II secretory pathway pseudopilin PulG